MAVFNRFTSNLCLFALLCSAILAAPFPELNDENGLVQRDNTPPPGQPGSSSNPRQPVFDISEWQDIAEQDCYVALCLLKGKRVYQRVANSAARGPNMRASGASWTPFQAAELAKRKTQQISGATVSAEEFPWESMTDGGAKAYVLPATLAQQDAQGTALTKVYNSGQVPYSNYFTLTFSNNGGSLGKYCTAFQKTPQDFSVCDENTRQYFFGVLTQIANFVFQVVRYGPTPYGFRHAAGPNQKPPPPSKRFNDSVLLFGEANNEEITL